MPTIIPSEARRRLSPVTFVSGRLTSLDLPRDSVFKRMQVYLRGSVTVTYAAGSPTFSPAGWMAKLCPRFDVAVDGSRLIKSIDFHMQRCLNAMYNTVFPRRLYSTSATAFTTDRAGTEYPSTVGGLAYPATTEYALINEEAIVYFEVPEGLAYSLGKQATLLNLRNVSSAEARFNFADITALQTDGVGATVTYSNIDLSFIVNMVENRNIAGGDKSPQFMDFKETIKRVSYSSESRDSQIDLPRGNKLAGIALQVRSGSTNRDFKDRALRDIRLLVNGQSIIQATQFVELQDDNQAHKAVVDSFTSGAHALRGFAWMPLVLDGDLSSALDTTIGNGVDQVSLQVTTPAATASASNPDGETYTNNVEVTVWSQELAPIPLSR